jgi:hypothetical protein
MKMKALCPSLQASFIKGEANILREARSTFPKSSLGVGGKMKVELIIDDHIRSLSSSPPSCNT